MMKTGQINNLEHRKLITDPIVDFAEPSKPPRSLSSKEEHKFLKKHCMG